MSILKLFGKNRQCISSITNWHSLSGRTIKNLNVYLDGFNDIRPDHKGPKFMAENVFLVNCNKNFVFYWFTNKTFPNVKNLYLASHPCEPSVLSKTCNIHLLDRYKSYADRWAKGKNINIFTQSELDAMLTRYKKRKDALFITITQGSNLGTTGNRAHDYHDYHD